MHYQKSSYILVFGIVLFLAGGCGVGRQSALSRKLFVKTSSTIKEDNNSTPSNQKEQQQKLSNVAYLAFKGNTAEDEVLLGNKGEKLAPREQSRLKTETVENKLLVNDKIIITPKFSKQNTYQSTQEAKSKEKQTKVFSILGISFSILAFVSFFASIFVTFLAFLVILLAIIGLILSAIALKNDHSSHNRYKTLSIIGIVFGAIALLGALTILITALGWFLGWWGGSIL